jgi:hypothetical protein
MIKYSDLISIYKTVPVMPDPLSDGVRTGGSEALTFITNNVNNNRM